MIFVTIFKVRSLLGTCVRIADYYSNMEIGSPAAKTRCHGLGGQRDAQNAKSRLEDVRPPWERWPSSKLRHVDGTASWSASYGLDQPCRSEAAGAAVPTVS